MNCLYFDNTVSSAQNIDHWSQQQPFSQPNNNVLPALAMAEHGLDIKKLAMIGCGSMGGGMAQLFAENDIRVSLNDPSSATMDAVRRSAARAGIPADMLHTYGDYASLCSSLDKPKVFVWSLPHGSVGDGVLEGLLPYLEKGDVIVDCGNEHWENTERRQGKCVTKGIRYVGCGVSGGYQAACVEDMTYVSIDLTDRLQAPRPLHVPWG